MVFIRYPLRVLSPHSRYTGELPGLVRTEDRIGAEGAATICARVQQRR